MQFGVLVQVCFGVWRFCKIDGRVLGGMQLWVLLEECGRPGVLLEVLVRNPPPVCRYLGSTLVFFFLGGGEEIFFWGMFLMEPFCRPLEPMFDTRLRWDLVPWPGLKKFVEDGRPAFRKQKLVFQGRPMSSHETILQTTLKSLIPQRRWSQNSP